MIKVTGSLQKSTKIMKLSNALVKLPQISQAMGEMSMEMTEVGLLSVRPFPVLTECGLGGPYGRDVGR